MSSFGEVPGGVGTQPSLTIQSQEVQMMIKTLTTAAALALLLLAPHQTTRAQKDGEAQAVIFDASSHPTLMFADKSAKDRICGALVSYTLMENQEEAIAARVTHFHVGRLGVKPSLAESGWLYITPTRIAFSVEEGDRSHGFDLPRTELKENRATDIGKGNFFVISNYVGMEIHLKEKLTASDSKTQKFAFTLVGSGRCDVSNSQPYSKFLKRAVKDFNGAVAEFKQVADSLKLSGRNRQIQAHMVPSLNERAPASAPDGNAAPPDVPPASPEPSPENPGDADAAITSDAAGAEIHADGISDGVPPSEIPLGLGTHHQSHESRL